ncbi:MAG: GNAT family N-acetyltransferase [Actinomycetota bacterium]
MSITTRPIHEDEVLEFRRSLARGFGSDLDEDVFPPEWFPEFFPLDRTVGAFDGDEIVGTLGGFPFEVTVPGGASIPMAGTTIVTVASTHRRRGVLTKMMRDHLSDTRSRNEPLVGLWASESVIYGRYGFGVATENEDVEMHQTRVSIEGEAGSVRLVNADEAAELLPPVYDAIRAERPGMLTRSAIWWKAEMIFDPEKRREGYSSQRYLIHETNGEVDGYALFRQKGDWSDGFPNGEVRIREVMSATPSAHTGMWRFLTSIDLHPKITYWNLPVDDPLRWKVADHRRVIRKRWDAMYLRILDVVAALEARTYAFDGVVTLSVDDPFLPEVGGAFELAVEAGIGSCRRIEEGPTDLAMSIVELSSLYLGAGHVDPMVKTGRVHGEAGVVELLGRMFRGDVQPWCEEIF